MRRRNRDVDAVPVLDGSFGKYAEELSFDIVGAARDEQARLLGVRLPGAVRIVLAHHQHPSVAIDVLTMQPVLWLVVRIGPNTRAAEASVSETRVRAVRVHPGNDVERPRVERVRDPLVSPVVVEEAVEQVQRGGGTGELHRMDLCVDEDRRLLLGRTGVEVRHRGDRDLASLVGLSDRIEPEKMWEGGSPGLERLGQLAVGVEAVELDAHERGTLLHRAQRARRIKRHAAGVGGAGSSHPAKASTSPNPASCSIAIHSFTV